MAGESREYSPAAELRDEVEPLPLLGHANLCLRQQFGQRNLLVLLALSGGEHCDLRGRILLQRKAHRLIERQAHHTGRRVRGQRTLLPLVLWLGLGLGLGWRSRRGEQETEKCYIKNNVRALGVLLGFGLFAASFGDFLDRRLVQASLRHQASTLMVDFLQQRLSGGVNEADATKVNVELFGRGSGTQFVPALL